MEKRRALTTEEAGQLARFARQEGRNWKETLMYKYWMKGAPVPGYDRLYGLRNTHGPSWLAAIDVRKLDNLPF